MVKIPSALKWMMDRRARILGEMKKVERRFDAREAILVKEIEKIRAIFKLSRNGC